MKSEKRAIELFNEKLSLKEMGNLKGGGGVAASQARALDIPEKKKKTK